MKLNQEFWNNRYLQKETPWDTGGPTTPLTHFIDQLTDLNQRILIPGAGRAHEAAYLYQKGFRNTFVCDWAEEALRLFQVNHPEFPEDHLICADFFKLDQHFDLVLEQTFFCAIDPSLRSNYVSKVHELLNEKGILAGLLFAEHFDRNGPPFGGNKEAYLALFTPLFDILEMDICEWSIKPRSGKELFFKVQKK